MYGLLPTVLLCCFSLFYFYFLITKKKENTRERKNNYRFAVCRENKHYINIFHLDDLINIFYFMFFFLYKD